MHRHPMQEIRTFFADHNLPYKSESESENENEYEYGYEYEYEYEYENKNENIENVGNSRGSWKELKGHIIGK